MTKRVATMLTGGTVPARQWNTMRDVVNELSDRLAGEQLLALVNELELERLPKIFRIKSILGVVLKCTYGSSVPTTDVEIDISPAPELVATSRNGITYTYTDVNNREDTTTPETQVLITPYLVGDVIEATQFPDGTWVDRNIAGRAWAEA